LRLFPGGAGGAVPFPLSDRMPEWREGWEVTAEEMGDAVWRMKPNKAPGLDGIPGKIWALVMGEVGGSLRSLFTRCLREGVFPALWKETSPPEGREGPRRPIGLPTSLFVG